MKKMNYYSIDYSEFFDYIKLKTISENTYNSATKKSLYPLIEEYYIDVFEYSKLKASIKMKDIYYVESPKENQRLDGIFYFKSIQKLNNEKIEVGNKLEYLIIDFKRELSKKGFNPNILRSQNVETRKKLIAVCKYKKKIMESAKLQYEEYFKDFKIKEECFNRLYNSLTDEEKLLLEVDTEF